MIRYITADNHLKHLCLDECSIFCVSIFITFLLVLLLYSPSPSFIGLANDLTILKASAQSDSEDVGDLLNMSISFLSKQNYSEGVAMLDKGLATHPNNTRLLELKSRVEQTQ